jgi:hypothetical protein
MKIRRLSSGVTITLSACEARTLGHLLEPAARTSYLMNRRRERGLVLKLAGIAEALGHGRFLNDLERGAPEFVQAHAAARSLWTTSTISTTSAPPALVGACDHCGSRTSRSRVCAACRLDGAL